MSDVAKSGGEAFDCKGRPIYPGDLLKSYHLPIDLNPYREMLKDAFPEWNVSITWDTPSINDVGRFARVRIYMMHKTKTGHGSPDHCYYNLLPTDELTDPAFPLEDYVRSDLHRAIEKERLRRKKRKAGHNSKLA